MIYTLTCNPALDYLMYLPGALLPGETNRSKRETVLPGGKGINVSCILKELGVENIALGFIAGDTGEWLRRMCVDIGLKTDFIRLENGSTRINVKLKGSAETEINAAGPCISQNTQDEMLAKISAFSPVDMLILSGNKPASLQADYYAAAAKICAEKGCAFAVDAEGDSLLQTLQYHPLLIKPNLAELQAISGCVLDSPQKLKDAANKLKCMGAQNVLVSMGAEGACLYSADGNAYFEPAPRGKCVNSVGAGDSMVAGFVAGLQLGLPPKQALHLAVCAGSATAFGETLASRDDIYSLYNR